MLPSEFERALRRRLAVGAAAGALAGLVAGFVAGTGLMAYLVDRVTRMPIPERAETAARLPRPRLTDAGGPGLNFGFRLEDAAGRPVSLATFRGKVIFLNLWATWCKPCVAELPMLAALYKETGGDPRFAFVSVAKDDAPTLERFVAKAALPFPVYRLPEGSELEGTGTAVPVTLIADRKGRILARVVGAANWSDPRFVAELRAQIEKE